MRIGILAPISWRVPPRHYGGWELVASGLVEGLVERGHEVTLFATADSVTEARLESICPRPLAEDTSLPTRVFEALHVAHAFERAGEFDLIHNHAGCFAVCYTRMTSTPVVTTLHGSGAETDSRIIYERYEDGYYVSISDKERQLVPSLNYVATVYNGIDLEKFTPKSDKGDYLLFLGRLSPDKGVELALEVASRTGRKLVLAGIVAPENREYFTHVIAPRVDGHQVRFVGPVDHRAKNILLGDAYAFLHLVNYEEAFGLTMVEAMSCGTPVIATRRGSVPEVVADGETGFVVEDVDQACRALADVATLSRAACRKHVESNFSLTRMVDGYLQVYEKVLRISNRRNPL
ncbi:MAG: glycosyltransferase family 4 protein [Chloroflexi bacterium]|nr:glycosyltransferase family 4 protein [Chloroflexota bacterium]